MLFLTDIRANIQQFRKKENNNPTAGKTIHLLEGYVGLDYFFPSNDKMIFADWFSGYLLILYEHETQGVELHLFTIDKGHVISHEERYNSHPHVEEDYDDLPF